MKKLLILSIFTFTAYGDDITINSTCYGTPKHIVVFGRVIKSKTIATSRLDDSWFTNLKRATKHLVSSELKNRTISLKFSKQKFTTTTDDEGFFNFEATAKRDTFNKTKLILSYKNVSNNCKLYIKPDSQSIGVISDFDDTIVVSNVTNKVELIKNTFLKNYKQRELVKGVVKKIKSILKENSPFFVVTGSPQRLQEPINNFLNYYNFPKRVVIAKKLNGKNSDSLLDQFKYKSKKLEKIFSIYPKTKWVLFGDSGEKDREVYNSLKAKYPNRVEKIYIRDLKSGKFNEI